MSSVVGLLLRKNSPELALLLGALTAALVLIASAGFLDGMRELREQVRRMTEGSELSVAPVLKCLAISIVTRFSTELCRDSGQNAAAAAMELAGCACAMSTVMPLLLSVLKMVGGFL